MTIAIGRLERIDEIRTIWNRETQFSDWLVTEEGLALISQDIGLELEGLQRESRPGD